MAAANPAAIASPSARRAKNSSQRLPRAYDRFLAGTWLSAAVARRAIAGKSCWIPAWRNRPQASSTCSPRPIAPIAADQSSGCRESASSRIAAIATRSRGGSQLASNPAAATRARSAGDASTWTAGVGCSGSPTSERKRSSTARMRSPTDGGPALQAAATTASMAKARILMAPNPHCRAPRDSTAPPRRRIRSRADNGRDGSRRKLATPDSSQAESAGPTRVPE